MKKLCYFGAVAITFIVLATPAPAQQVSGTVKWFNETKGFGFIQPDAGGPDIFVHISAVERAGLATLEEDQKIYFQIVTDPRTSKTRAENLSVPK